ncbi:selenocysteine lyase/cysteine desulfurase [Kineococcus xinjiangensis]|uniref:Selenocysteine lyase/cysteine desulfurase n=1 Tax=Kineococcus xinjiangensis TaxID=512762 RepID=A0A2S6IJ02_9ACTN|nr:aminotransferase class V-fold PLP-dependent enzyme [Kineococcus xinjiangensis]PPK94202.1 selenocysteine lyase/cysteine desulfurase [Kineococcus xinjiangensis]
MTTPDPTAALAAAASTVAARRGYLATASTGLPSQAVLAAVQNALAAWAGGRLGPEEAVALVERARGLFARLLATTPDRVAAGSQASVAVGVVAACVPDGGRVLCAEGDYTSLTWPFAAHAHRGVRVETAPLAHLPEVLAAGRHDWVAVSAVQSADGRVLDLARLRAAAAEAGARVLLDTTQAVGWLPLRADTADVTVTSLYKWVPAPRGACLTTFGERALAELRPSAAAARAAAEGSDPFYGWPPRLRPDARRFDVAPAWAAWAGAVPALETALALGVEAVHAHDVRLADALLQALGSPPAGSAVVSVPASEAARAALAAAGLRTSLRGGRVRLAFHWWNDEEDVELAATALRAR